MLGHINNLYNTTFWALQQKGGMSATEAENELKVTRAPFLYSFSIREGTPPPLVSSYFPRRHKRILAENFFFLFREL